MPAAHHQPCLVLDDQYNPVPSQAFFVENWGGVYIHSTSSDQAPGRHVLGVKELGGACGAFVGFLCQVLGLRHTRSDPATSGVALRWDKRTGIAAWEVAYMVRTRLATLLHGTQDKLVALSNLVEGIPSVVVEDEVGERANQAMRLYDKAVALTQSGQLQAALQQATAAYDHAAEAFHHPTMMAYLYFPDEFRLAVYFPLVVPIAVPLLSNAMKLC